MADRSGWSLLARFGPLLLVAVLVVAAFAAGFSHHVSMADLDARRESLRALIALHPVLGAVTYILTYALLVGLSLPVALALTLTAGFLFGPWLGAAVADIGCTLGACMIFLICRTAAGDLLKRRGGAKIAKIEAGLREDAFLYLLTFRLMPWAPFWLVNLAAGLVEMPLKTFFLATLIGILPMSLIYAALGSGLGHAFGARGGMEAMHSPRILIPLAALSLLSLAPIVIRRLKRRAASLPDGRG